MGIKIALIIVFVLGVVGLIVYQYKKRKKKRAEHQKNIENFDKIISEIDNNINLFIYLHENFDEAEDELQKTLQKMKAYLLFAGLLMFAQSLRCEVANLFCNQGFGYSFDDKLAAKELQHYKKKEKMIKEKLSKANIDFVAFFEKYKKDKEPS